MGRAKRAIVIAAFTLASCSSQVIPAATPTSNSANLRLYTTSSTAPLMNQLVESYRAASPNVTFDMRVSDYRTLASQVSQENTFYFLSNHLPPDSPLWAAPIAQDGIVIITHPDNPVENVSLKQIREIFQGYINNWQQVGGKDMPVQVVTRESSADTKLEFDRLVMGDRQVVQSAIVAPASRAMLDIVTSTPGSVGYLSNGQLLPGVRPVSIEGVFPTRATIRNNTYPLRVTLFIIGEREPAAGYRTFIAWVQSKEGQAAVSDRYSPLVFP